MHICEQCGKEHDGTYGSGRFCSSKCKQKHNIEHPKKDCVCRFCGRKFNSSVALGGHIISCKNNPNYGKAKEHSAKTVRENNNRINPIEEHTIKCSVCGQEFKINVRRNSFKTGDYRHTCSIRCSHKRVVSEEQKDKIRRGVINYMNNHGYAGNAKHKELKLETYICENCGKKFKLWNKRFINGKKIVFYSKRFCCKKCAHESMKQKVSQFTKLRCSNGEFGGINNDTYKKHKHGWYKGLYCGSSWELAFVIFSIDHGKVVHRCNLKLPYTYNNKTYNYYPDYEIDGEIYEIKGFENFKAIAKHNTYPNIKWYNKDIMKPILKYVIEKYGKNYDLMLCETKEKSLNPS